MNDGLAMRAHRFGESVILDIAGWRCLMDVPAAEVLGSRLLELATDAEHDQADIELATLVEGRNCSKPPREPGMIKCECRCGHDAPAWQHAPHCPKAQP